MADNHISPDGCYSILSELENSLEDPLTALYSSDSEDELGLEDLGSAENTYCGHLESLEKTHEGACLLQSELLQQIKEMKGLCCVLRERLAKTSKTCRELIDSFGPEIQTEETEDSNGNIRISAEISTPVSDLENYTSANVIVP